MGKSIIILIILVMSSTILINFSLSLLSIKSKSHNLIENQISINTNSSLTEINNIIESLSLGGYRETLGNLPQNITVTDISSKINPNFIDFSIFQEEHFKELLQDEFTWQDLYLYRKKIGFTTDITDYFIFFKEPKELLTIHNIPNINNASDDVLEILFTDITITDSGNLFRQKIVSNRKNGLLINKENSSFFYAMYDKELIDFIGINGTWNVNTIHKDLLLGILSKNFNNIKIPNYIDKFNKLIELREIKDITEKELLEILNPKDHYKTIETYLGVITTFYLIAVEQDIENHSFIFKLSDKEYKCISYTKEVS